MSSQHTTSDPIEVWYFGCANNQAGHYWRSQHAARSSGGPEGFPWPNVDGTLTPTDTRAQSESSTHHLDGWSAVAFHDYTVDQRPKSNSVFVVNRTLPTVAVMALAAAAFPEIVRRIAEAAAR